jgi:quercetin dioxygenase-like cupin family protein
MNSWTITNLDLRPHAPEILASTDEARAIALMIPAGESFGDHQVHESAWVTVIEGEVQITTSGGESVIGSTGLVVAFAPNERHAVHARSDARLLLLLTPWPGVDHPGAMTLDQKANARRDAAERRPNALRKDVGTDLSEYRLRFGKKWAANVLQGRPSVA